jgi:broad specificity polyphosphatase/5'/3'-nucleotidase SurE
LAKREQEIKRKSELLDEQLSNVSRKEQKASDMIEKCETKAAETTLALLDEHFTCSLYVSSIYSINAPNSLHDVLTDDVDAMRLWRAHMFFTRSDVVTHSMRSVFYVGFSPRHIKHVVVGTNTLHALSAVANLL